MGSIASFLHTLQHCVVFLLLYATRISCLSTRTSGVILVPLFVDTSWSDVVDYLHHGGEASSASEVVVQGMAGPISINYTEDEPYTQPQVAVLTFMNVTLENFKLIPLPEVSIPDVKTIQHQGLPTSPISNQFLCLGLYDNCSETFTRMIDVDIVVDCETLYQYQRHVCAHAISNNMEISNSNTLLIKSWSSSSFSATNVALRCTGYLSNPPLAPPVCVVIPATSPDTLYTSVQYSPEVPLVYVSVLANISLTNEGLWASNQTTFPAVISRIVVLQGQTSQPTIFDPQLRRFVFSVTSVGLLVFKDMFFINLPIGPPQSVPGLWMLGAQWFAKTLRPPEASGPFLVNQNCGGELPADYMTYLSLWVGRLASPIPQIHDAAAWYAPYAQNMTIISATNNTVHYGRLVGVVVSIFNGFVRWGDDARFTSLLPNTGIMDCTDKGKVPMTQILPVEDCSTLLSAIILAQSSVWEDQYVLMLLGNITLLPDAWPHGPVVLNTSVVWSRWGEALTYIDFKGRMNVFSVLPGVKLQLRNLYLLNLPIAPAQRLGLFTVALWPFQYDRTVTSTLTLVNVTIVTSVDELRYLQHPTDMQYEVPFVDPALLASWQSQWGFGYESTQLRLSADPGFDYLPVVAPVQYSTLAATYGSDVEFSTSIGLQGWQVAAICVGVIAGVLPSVALVFAVWWWRRHKLVAEKPVVMLPPDHSSLDIVQNKRETLPGTDPVQDAQTQVQLVVAQLNSRIHDQNLQLQNLLGKGAYGEVYQGRWRELTVAVKVMIVSDADLANRRNAAQEVAVLVNLSHPNVVITYSYDIQEAATPNASPADSGRGPTAHKTQLQTAMDAMNDAQLAELCQAPTPPKLWKLFLIQEFCNGGPLRVGIDTNFFTHSTGETNITKVLYTALDVAKGMAHVHSKNIIHGDLNPNNILLQAQTASPYNFIAKVADFGLSVIMDANQTHVSNANRGTMFYAAPEVMLRATMTKSADVYSFGIILWELFHGPPPWRRKRMQPVINPAVLLRFAAECPMQYRMLCVQCLAVEPDARPCFDQMVPQLQALLQLMQGTMPQGVRVEGRYEGNVNGDKDESFAYEGSSMAGSTSRYILMSEETNHGEVEVEQKLALGPANPETCSVEMCDLQSRPMESCVTVVTVQDDVSKNAQ